MKYTVILLFGQLYISNQPFWKLPGVTPSIKCLDAFRLFPLNAISGTAGDIRPY